VAERRISFSAVDNGVSTTLDKLRRSSQEISRGMIEEARKYSQSGKQQIEFIEQQIKAIERRNRLEREGREMSARETFQAGGSKADFAKTMGTLRIESEQDEMQIKLLRELIETIRLTSKEEIAEDKKSVIDRIQEQKRGFLSSMLFGKTALSPEDQLKTSLQEEILGDKGKAGGRGGVMGDVFAGTFLANMLQRGLGMLNALPGARNEEAALSQILGGVPVLGGAYGRSSEEQLSAEIGRTRLRGLGVRRRFGFSQFGFDMGESAQQAESAMTAAGTSNVNVGNFVALQRAFSLDPGLLQERLKVGRFSGGQDQLLSEITKLLAASGLQEDRVLFAELLRNQTQLVQEFGMTAETVNQGIATGVITMFNNVGGGFSMRDPRSMQRISQINQGLSRPGNDIMRAENFSVLRRMNPNAGIFDIMQMQEQGLQTPGFLQGVLGNISNRFGGDDQMAMMALQQRLGLSFAATRQLYQNRQAIMSGGGQDIIEGIMKDSDVDKMARENTAALVRSQAEIANAFVDGLLPGMLDVGQKVGVKIAEEIDKVTKGIKIFDWIKNQGNIFATPKVSP